MLKNLKLSNILLCLIVAVVMLTVVSCTTEEEGCETETVCFGEGNCVEKPIPGTCFN